MLRRAFAVAAVVCLVLLALLTVAQVAHSHATTTDADHCQLCMVLHSVTPAAVATVLLSLTLVTRAVPAEEVRAVARYWHPQLFTRPPPAK